MSRTAGAALRVARREFVERATSRAFLISNAVILVVLVVAIGLPQVVGGDDAVRTVGYVPEAEDTARAVAERGPLLGTEVELVPLDADSAVGQAAVRPPDQRDSAPSGVPDEQLDAVLRGGQEVLVWRELPSDLEAVLSTAARDVTIRDTLTATDLTAAQQQALLSPPSLDVEAVSPLEEVEEGPGLAAGAVAVFLLYGLLLFYGQTIAQGIVEEKSSRVVEVLLSTVRPAALLFGKILGLTALGVAQTIALAVVGLGAALTFLDVEVPSEAYGTVALAVAWFLLGFLLYATVFAVAASLVSRQEDLQTTMLPAFIPIILGFVVAQYALQEPQSTVSLVGGIVPFTAPLVQPLRYGAGVVDAWEVPVALLLCLLTIALLLPLAARFYAGGVLRFGGRVGLGEAWRGSRG